MKGNGRERKGKTEGSADVERGDPGVLAPQGCGAPASPMPAPYNPHSSPTAASGSAVPACAGTQPQHRLGKGHRAPGAQGLQPGHGGALPPGKVPSARLLLLLWCQHFWLV